MPKTLSLDLRERIWDFMAEGHSCREAARIFRVSVASAVRIGQRKRRTGSVAADKRGRPRGSGKLEPFRDFLRARVDETPDITMPELAGVLWQAHGVRANPAMLSRFLKHQLGYRYKKIPDRHGARAPAGPPRPLAVAALPPAENAP